MQGPIPEKRARADHKVLRPVNLGDHHYPKAGCPVSRQVDLRAPAFRATSKVQALHRKKT